MPENVPFPGATRRQVIWGRESLAVGPVRFNEEEWPREHLGLRKVLEWGVDTTGASEPSGKETLSTPFSSTWQTPAFLPLYLPGAERTGCSGVLARGPLLGNRQQSYD